MQFTVTILSTLALMGSKVLAQDAAGAASTIQVGGSSPSSAAAAAPSGSSAATPSSGSMQVQVVQVGGATPTDLVFVPNDIKAAPGTMVQFQFNPKNHSVTQSTFAQPCIPINNNQPSIPGFFSGFMPVTPSDTQKPTFTLMVNDTKPIWIYCAQGRHCQSGMVAAINAPPTGNTLAAFTALAAKAPLNLAPGQSNTTTNSTISTGSGSTTTPPIVTSTGAAAGGRLLSAKQAYTGAALSGLVAAFAVFAL